MYFMNVGQVIFFWFSQDLWDFTVGTNEKQTAKAATPALAGDARESAKFLDFLRVLGALGGSIGFEAIPFPTNLMRAIFFASNYSN